MIFQENYTTAKRKEKDNEKEKNKIEVSEETFAICETIQSLINQFKSMGLKKW